MADLAYSLDLLRNLGRELTGLADAMDGTAARTSWDRDEVGHRRVADALEGFADSWDDKRERLTASLRDVGTMATESAQTFQDVDDQLAAEVAGILETE
jgi:hypothetical protein